MVTTVIGFLSAVFIIGPSCLVIAYTIIRACFKGETIQAENICLLKEIKFYAESCAFIIIGIGMKMLI